LRAYRELSELESALLDVHLQACEACRSFALGAAKVAALLRSSLLERPLPGNAAAQRRSI
jgi:predicted anti-sigma-YlaC factor YlaD